jgi:hypothetical protein
MEDQIYLCTIDDLAGPGEDPQAQLMFFSKILEKVGYLLISDKEHYDLFAMKPEDLPPAPVWSGLLSASDFERRFLAWIHINTGVLPSRDPDDGTAWTFHFRDLPVRIAIRKGEVMTWSLTIEETEPCPFTAAVAAHFADPRYIPTHLAGRRIRTVYTAGDLVRELVDQTDRT